MSKGCLQWPGMPPRGEGEGEITQACVYLEVSGYFLTVIYTLVIP